MQARARYVHASEYNLFGIAQQYVASKLMGEPIHDLLFKRGPYQNQVIDLGGQFLVLAGGRNSIRQGLALGGSKEFVAAPNQQIFANFIQWEPGKAQAAYGAAAAAGSMAFGPAIQAGAAMARGGLNGVQPMAQYGRVMGGAYTTGTVNKLARSVGLMAKTITVVGLHSAPASPNSIRLGAKATAAQIAITLAKEWGI